MNEPAIFVIHNNGFATSMDNSKALTQFCSAKHHDPVLPNFPATGKRLLLSGSDALEGARQKLAALATDYDTLERTTALCDFND